MTRPRKLDEQLWEDSEEALSADHVVERYFAQHERTGDEVPRKPHAPPRAKRRPGSPPDAEN
jgi:hypothetical protein